MADVPEPPNGWSRFERVIVYRLDKLDKDVGDIRVELKDDIRRVRTDLQDLRDDEIGKIKIEVAMLKVKSSLWGAGAGFLPAALVAVYFLLSR